MTEQAKRNSQDILLGMTTWEEQMFIQDWVERNYNERGTIIDLGCRMGSTTIPLARALEARGLSGKRILAFDLFRWEKWMES